jgi:hypothetical protein
MGRVTTVPLMCKAREGGEDRVIGSVFYTISQDK